VPARQFLRRFLHGIRRRLGALPVREFRPAWALPTLAMMAIVGAVVYSNLPVLPGPIRIVEASYGENCRATVLQPPLSNYFQPGNATNEVKKACRGQAECRFEIDVNRLGDPVHGCAKDFSVLYQCRAANELHTAALPGEAHGHAVSIACN
jgi:hypothetical protein